MAANENKSSLEIQKLIEQVKEYRPAPSGAYASAETSTSPRRLVISMFGNVGVGKSSLINSFLSIFHPDGNVAKADIASKQYQRGKTLCRNCYNLTNQICLVDNRGMVNLDSKEAIKEVIAQIEGKRGYDKEVRVGAPVPDDDGEPVHFILYVVDGSSPDNSEKGFGLDMIQSIQISHGRTPKAVVTHDDIAEKNQIDATKDYLDSLGINDTIVVGNVTNERTALEERYKKSLLELLAQCVSEGDWMIERMARRVWVRKEQQRMEEERRREDERREEERRRQEREQMAEIARSVAAGIAAGAAAMIAFYFRLKK